MEPEQQLIKDEEEDLLTPRTFIVLEESDATKSIVEKLEKVMKIVDLHTQSQKQKCSTFFIPHLWC